MLEPISQSKHGPASNTRAQSILTSLRSPIDTLEILETHLFDIISALNTIPRSFSKRPHADLSSEDILPILPAIQHLVLSVLLPTWLAPLRDAGHLQFARQLFCPALSDAPSGNGDMRCKVVMMALPVILAYLPVLVPKDAGIAAILDFCLSLLEGITTTYPVDVIYCSIFSVPSDNGKILDEDRKTRDWEDHVRAMCSVPGKVANALHERIDIHPLESLQHGPFFTRMCVSSERLISEASQDRASPHPQIHLVLKLLNLGFFPRAPPALPSQPSFFVITLPTIRGRIEGASTCYSESWAAIVRSLPFTSQQTFVASLLGALDCTVGLDTSPKARRQIRDATQVLRGLLGTMTEGDEQLWSTVAAVVCGSRAGEVWDMSVARAVVQWIAEPQLGEQNVNKKALEKLLDATLAIWTDPTYIRHSLLKQHRYTSTLLLLTLNPLPHAASRLALYRPFISSITTYLARLDESVRRCGMLVAEVVAQMGGKNLAFGGWDGEDERLEWARCVRGWRCDWDTHESEPESEPETENGARPKKDSVPYEPPTKPPSSRDDYDSDDSLTGYASSPSSSSRAPSPTPSELAEMEKDPTIRRPKPVARPVYIAQLAPMLRADQRNEEGAVERVAAALSSAEGLVRRKKGFGLELEENAVELAIALIGLHDTYELPGFDTQRQAALVALVACCPQKAALTLVEQFFTNQYAIVQRIAILTALALGARELAGLPVPVTPYRGASLFPTKTLPPELHWRYVGGDEVQSLVKDISNRALTDVADTESQNPTPAPLVRSKQLRVGRLGSTRVTPVATLPQPRERTRTFTDVASEHFVMPLINHMWRHLRSRGSSAGVGAGTGLVLTPVVLAQYLGTLAVLLHAARNVPAYLAVLAPSTLELVLLLGSQPVGGNSKTENEDADSDAAVLTAALETTLVVLDGCVALDGGRDLGLERTALLLAVEEWAGGVLVTLERGSKISGGGGIVEGRVAAAAAGVLGKVGKVKERWGRAIIEV